MIDINQHNQMAEQKFLGEAGLDVLINSIKEVQKEQSKSAFEISSEWLAKASTNRDLIVPKPNNATGNWSMTFGFGAYEVFEHNKKVSPHFEEWNRGDYSSTNHGSDWKVWLDDWYNFLRKFDERTLNDFLISDSYFYSHLIMWTMKPTIDGLQARKPYDIFYEELQSIGYTDLSSGEEIQGTMEQHETLVFLLRLANTRLIAMTDPGDSLYREITLPNSKQPCILHAWLESAYKGGNFDQDAFNEFMVQFKELMNNTDTSIFSWNKESFKSNTYLFKYWLEEQYRDLKW